MKAAYVQFSKRIAIVILVFWAVYRLATLVLVSVNLSLASALTSMQSGVDDVMMVSIGFYTGNSVIEKGIVGYFNRKVTTDTGDNQITATDTQTEPEGQNG